MALDPQLYDRPSTPRQEYVDAAPDITLIRDLLGGTRRMHTQFREYIPKYKAEKQDAYKRRATAAKVYGGLGRTLSASVGMLFAKPPELSDNWPAQMTQQWENIDGKGTHGSVFAKRHSEDSIADGIVGILVDFPKAPADVVVHGGNEQALNLRPFWSAYHRADILSWKTKIVNNVEALSQIVLRETANVDQGRFGVLSKPQYRVCYMAMRPANDGEEPQLMAVWDLLEEQRDGTGNVTVVRVDNGDFRDRAGQPFDEIPFAIAYAGRTDETLCAQPPLLDVAWANLEHWRVATNLRFYEDMCCFPQPYIKGELARGPNGETLPFVSGPGVLVNVTKDSEYEIKELTGSSIRELRASLQEKKDEISELGMSFLAKKTRGVETAEAKRLDATAENSTLATAAQGIEDGINQALVFHARYEGIAEEEAPTLKINRDFDMIALDPATMAVYVQAVAQAGLPPETLIQAWVSGGRLPPDTDVEKMAADIMANQAAIADQKAAEAAAKVSDGPAMQEAA